MTELGRPEMPTASGSCAGAESDSSTSQIVSNRTSDMAHSECHALVAVNREVASRVPRLGSSLDPRDHRPGKPGDALCGRIGRGQLHRTHAGHQSFMDGYERTVEEAGIQYVRGNEDASCYS